MKTSIFEQRTQDHLKEFINEWALVADIDKEKAFDLANGTVRYFNKRKNSFKTFQDLEDRWYQSLDNGNPDYSIYDDQYILSDIWACWVIFSRGYLLSIADKRSLIDHSIVSDLGEIKSIVDLGCGFGYTTAGLKELFPQAKVYGTNFEGGSQWKLANHFGSKYDFSIIPSIDNLNESIDLIFASEYFEHIENAIDHLKDIVEKCKPKALIVANAFGTKSIGHFINHSYDNNLFDGKTTSKLFNEYLKSKGYSRIKTKCWNNRPTYWKL